MESFVGLIVMLFAAMIVVRLLPNALQRRPFNRQGSHGKAAQGDIDYEGVGVPFTATERRFLEALDEAVGEDHRIFAKMRVADVLRVGRVENRSEWQRAFNLISAKHVDFVVCDRATLAVIAAVELDDRSHDALKRRQRDAFLERAFESASVRLARVPVADAYSAVELRRQVLGVVETVVTSSGEQVSRATEVRHCHACGSPMELRRADRGGAVQEYFACTNAPRCHVRVALRYA